MTTTEDLPQPPPRRVLVTGANGFIGSHAAAALGPGAVLANPAGKRFDLLKPEDRLALIAESRADALLHLAWYTKHGAFWHSDENMAWQDASIDLFRRFYDAGGTRIVAAGSCAEYDWTTDAAQFGEDAPLAPAHPYGAAKVRTCEALAAMDGDWAWGRIFFAYGLGEAPQRLVPALLRSVKETTAMGIGPADTERDFLHVADLGAATATLALSDVQGVVNLASGIGVRFDQLASTIERLGKTAGLIRPGERSLGPGEPRSLVANVTRLRTEVGFDPQIGLEQGLRDYLAKMP